MRRCYVFPPRGIVLFFFSCARGFCVCSFLFANRFERVRGSVVVVCAAAAAVVRASVVREDFLR